MHGLVKIGARSFSFGSRTHNRLLPAPTVYQFLHLRQFKFLDRFLLYQNPQEKMQEKIIFRLKWLTFVVLLFMAMQIVLTMYR
jgi:hypothetical protein